MCVFVCMYVFVLGIAGMCVHVYMCIRVCVYVCMLVHVNALSEVCVCVCLHQRAHVSSYMGVAGRRLPAYALVHWLARVVLQEVCGCRLVH